MTENDSMGIYPITINGKVIWLEHEMNQVNLKFSIIKNEIYPIGHPAPPPTPEISKRYALKLIIIQEQAKTWKKQTNKISLKYRANWQHLT